jgi:CRP-like cAMP-binding protein
MAGPNDKQISKLRAAWDKAVEKDKPKDAVEPLQGLEKLEPREPKWPHRLGDLLRRLGRPREAEAAYERALRIYQQGGFLARAVAMAKTIVDMNPARASILEELDADAARSLRRQSKPQMFLPKAAPVLVPSAPPMFPPDQPPPPPPRIAGAPANRMEAIALAPKLKHAPDQAHDELRFDDVNANAEPSVEIDICELDPSLARPTATSSDGEEMAAAEAPVPTAEQLALMTSGALFADVGKDVLVELARAAALEHHAPGAVVFRRGDPAVGLYVIVEGGARVQLADARATAELGEGQVFGEGCLLEGGTRGADVSAVTELTVLSIPKVEIDRLVSKDASLGNVLFNLLVTRLVANAIQTTPMFAAFDVATRVELARLFEVRRAPAGVRLKQEGKRSDGLYIGLAGALSMETGGKSAPIPLGQMFGQQSLLTSAPSTQTVTAVRESVVLRLPATRFGTLAAQYPPALAALSEMAAD